MYVDKMFISVEPTILIKKDKLSLIVVDGNRIRFYYTSARGEILSKEYVDNKECREVWETIKENFVRFGDDIPPWITNENDCQTPFIGFVEHLVKIESSGNKLLARFEGDQDNPVQIASGESCAEKLREIKEKLSPISTLTINLNK